MNTEELYQVILLRKQTKSKGSYVASLFREGIDTIVQKVGEEAVETVVAAKGKSKQRVIEEVADVWFHILVLLAHWNITPKDIFTQLEKRHREKK